VQSCYVTSTVAAIGALCPGNTAALCCVCAETDSVFEGRQGLIRAAAGQVGETGCISGALGVVLCGVSHAGLQTPSRHCHWQWLAAWSTENQLQVDW